MPYRRSGGQISRVHCSCRAFPRSNGTKRIMEPKAAMPARRGDAVVQNEDKAREGEMSGRVWDEVTRIFEFASPRNSNPPQLTSSRRGALLARRRRSRSCLLRHFQLFLSLSIISPTPSPTNVTGRRVAPRTLDKLGTRILPDPLRLERGGYR